MSKTNALELTEVMIWPVRNPENSRVKAMASLTFNGMIRVNSCRVIEGAKGLFVSFPAEKRPGTDEWTSFVHPVTREASDKIQEQVVARYNELLSIQG
jgi:stage V sporulation protein G